MDSEPRKMKPIWYFVGLMLLAMGAVVVASGIYHYLNPGTVKTVLADLHPDLWWGAVMIVAGAIFFLVNRKVRVD